MIAATRAINQWLHSHNINPEGVRVVVEFPSDSALHHAKAALERDLRPLMLDMTRPAPACDTMNGIGLVFRSSGL